MIDLAWDGMTQCKGNPEQTKVFRPLKWVRSSYVPYPLRRSGVVANVLTGFMSRVRPKVASGNTFAAGWTGCMQVWDRRNPTLGFA